MAVGQLTQPSASVRTVMLERRQRLACRSDPQSDGTSRRRKCTTSSFPKDVLDAFLVFV